MAKFFYISKYTERAFFRLQTRSSRAGTSRGPNFIYMQRCSSLVYWGYRRKDVLRRPRAREIHRTKLN